MKRIVLIAAGFAVAVAAVSVSFTARQRAEAVKTAQIGPELMRMKLEQAKILLESLALEDYERIGTSSERLKEISIQAQWTQPHSERFGIFGDEFRTALTRMGDNALEKNLDGVTLNFMQMVASCVECHEVVREGEMVALAPTAAYPLNDLLSKRLD